MKKISAFFIVIAIALCVIPAFVPCIAAHTQSQAETEKTITGAANSEAHLHVPHLDGKNMSLLWAVPFAGILLSIALFPLFAPHFWHEHYGKVALFWGAAFFLAFLIIKGPSMSFFYLIETYFLEFFPFIILLLSLFAVAGGIRLKGELIGSPLVNLCMILIGTFLASWMGTTGAAMLMIRPMLRANAWRKYKTHVVVFFIFLVANIGGSLTPLGDPPLFMGFLKGVSFFWTTKHLIFPFLATTALLAAVFFIIDSIYYKKEPTRPHKSHTGEKLSLEGKRNILLIPLIPAAVLFSSTDMGTAFTLHMVEIPVSSVVQMGLLLLIAFISIRITPKDIRINNDFTWEPIREVAKLFAVIFITIVPLIAMLKAGTDGPLGIIIKSLTGPDGQFINSHFFWITGTLSGFLDNAPTYVIFFNAVGGDAISLMGVHAKTLMAISVGAVFMGANTYIGNAPNFMVKSIAEEHEVNMPTFFGYMLKYTLPILIPTFILVTLIFF